MDRVIATGSVAVGLGDIAPTTGTPGQFVEGNPATNTPATRVPAYQLNAMQEEIIGTILGAGLTPDKANNGLLLASILSLIDARGRPGHTYSGLSDWAYIDKAGGLVLQWYRHGAVTTSGVTVTLPTAFDSTNFTSAGSKRGGFANVWADAATVGTITATIETGGPDPVIFLSIGKI